MKIVFFTLIFLSSFARAEDCEIAGEAILWAYDACFWKHETDDSIHPGVIECVEDSQEEIMSHGECPARLLFKSRICELAKLWNLTEPNPETCMAIDMPLGSAVKEGGI